jgi:hypothetical protein
VESVEGKLFVELTEARSGWLWRNDKIDNKPEAVPSYCFGKLMEKGKGRMGCIGDEVVPIAWCDSLL